MSANVIDTADQVRDLIDVIDNTRPRPAFIFIDIEGVDVSRNGSIAIIQVLVPPEKKVYLVDVHVLKAEAFDTPSNKGLTLRTILESEQMLKVFFDIRNDSDALYNLFNIDVSGIIDLQLLEFATRRIRGKFVKGLSKCISEGGVLSWQEASQWQECKDQGKKLFAPERGGRYEVFLERPIPPAIVDYCTQDVLCMPELLLGYSRRMDANLGSQVQSETKNRILFSQSPHFNGKGKHMALGPHFALNNSAPQSSLTFPMDIVCSTDLVKHCTFATTPAVDPTLQNDDVATATFEMIEERSTREMSLFHSLSFLPSGEQPGGVDSNWDPLEDAPENDFHDSEEAVSGFRSEEESDTSSGRDFTACSASSCGYCGHCGY